MYSVLSLLLTLLFAVCSAHSMGELVQSLKEADKIERSYTDRLPIVYDGALQVGYLNMPSARMNTEGMIAAGFGHISPYNIISVNAQPFTRMELSANYRIFYGQKEYHMSKYGFGDDADRTANVKLLLLSKNDGCEFFPEIAFGMEDFYGTKRFESYYFVATKEWLQWNIETTFGWGWKRLNGPFFGIAWTPFRHSKTPIINSATLLAEYDAIDYENHIWEHNGGRDVASKINGGISLTAFDIFQVKFASQRGNSFAVQGSMNYNLGTTKGLFPKTEDAPLWKKPVDIEPLGHLRTEKELAQDFAYAFAEQGLTLSTLSLTAKEGVKGIWLKLINIKYRVETDLKNRLENILSALTPDNINEVTAVVEANGVPAQQYTFRFQDLDRFRRKQIGREELDALSPISSVEAHPSKYESQLLFSRKKPVWTVLYRPRLLSFFGSSRGKYKYSFGVIGGLSGYLFDQVYYASSVSYTIKSTINDIQDRDFYNPSSLLNVRSDAIRYFQQNTINLEYFFLQKGFSAGKGVYFRLAGGYFEPMYGGVAAETLFYPPKSTFAFGLSGAAVLKRNYSGLGFMHTIRKWNGDVPEYVDFVGYQYFLNLYYYFKLMNIELSAKIGQFLARDVGSRFEVARYYPSGLRLSFWYTLTNAQDFVNGHRYHDRGVAIAFPLDIFLQKSSRAMLAQAMSFWLRDTGAIAGTGVPLYQTLEKERRGYVYNLY